MTTKKRAKPPAPSEPDAPNPFGFDPHDAWCRAIDANTEAQAARDASDARLPDEDVGVTPAAGDEELDDAHP